MTGAVDLSPRTSNGRTDDGALAGRRFLIVSAPFGPFSRVLAKTLRAAGARVRRVVANGGDLLDWGLAEACVFQGRPKAWPAWIAARVAEATDIVLFGDSAETAQAAAAAARAAGARVWVLENGYFRPHWITLERDGVNAASSLPRSRAFYAASDLPRPPPARPVGRVTPHHVFNLTRYFVVSVALRPLFPFWRAPYAIPLWRQAAGHFVRYLRLTRDARRTARDEVRIMTWREPYFLAFLQREGDSQLVRHAGPVATNAAFVNAVLDSFSAHAPPHSRLVIKNHPLDPGVQNLGRVVARAAWARGLADRVVFLDGGNLTALARRARGVVAVNSTAALASIGFGTPVKLLGEAVFDIPGLVDRRPLDLFWREPAAPDADLFQRFRRYVTWTTQVNGSFHAPRHLVRTAENLRDAILRRDADAVPQAEAS